MRNDRDYYMMSFNSTHNAMHAEALLRPHISLAIMPTLRQISASCGISIRFESKDFETLTALLNTAILSSIEYLLYYINEDGQAVFIENADK